MDKKFETTLSEVYVYIYHSNEWVCAGRLAHDDSTREKISAFKYLKSYFLHPAAVSLDDNLLPLDEELNKDGFQTEEGFDMFGAIRDASPDGWGRYVLSKKFPHIALGELHYLSAGSPDRVGNLAFGPNRYDGPKIWTPTEWIDYVFRPLDFSTLQDGIEQLAKAQKSEEEYKSEAFDLVKKNGTGSGGARPKANVIWNNKLHLAKFSISTDQYNITALEYGTMSLAKKCGLDIPNIDKTQAIGRDVFLIERFDREEGKNEEPMPFVSALTLCNLAENDYDSFKYENLCDAIVKHCDAPKDQLLKLFKRVSFNIMVNNNDDHLRNYGFIKNKRGKWVLSPHYDVVPDENSTGGHCHLSLSIGRLKIASKENIISNCHIFMLEKEEATSIFEEMQQKVTSLWKEELRNAGLSQDTIARFEHSFKEK